MLTVSPQFRGALLESVIIDKLGEEAKLERVLSSSGQLGRLGVLLAQTIRYMDLDYELAIHFSWVEGTVKAIRKLSRRSLSAEKIGGKSSKATKLATLRSRKNGRGSDIVALRMSIPSTLAERLLALTPSIRKEVLWYATTPSISRTVDLRRLIESEVDIADAGRHLNIALRKAGKERDCGLLLPAVSDAFVVMIGIFRPNQTSEEEFTNQKNSGV